jgi:hypothetical protein
VPEFAAPGARAGEGLPPVPDLALIEEGDHGLLPRLGPNGRRPADVYARPAEPSDGRPVIALVIGGLGLSAEATRAAIEALPPEVVLAFSPHGRNLQSAANRARAAGHETMLELPLEPFDYPANDPGPYTLLTGLDPAENRERLHWLLSRYAGYTGLVVHEGGRFTSAAPALTPVLEELGRRGLLLLDNGRSPQSLVRRLAPPAGLEAAVAVRSIDSRPSRIHIDDSLLDLETIARNRGVAVGVGFAYPVTIEQVAAWAPTLQAKGLSLVPLSAAIDRSQS